MCDDEYSYRREKREARKRKMDELAALGRRSSEVAMRDLSEKSLAFAQRTVAGYCAGARVVLPGIGERQAFRYCPPGAFKMGTDDPEHEEYENAPVHDVVLSRGFWIGQTPVTVRFYSYITGKTHSSFSDAPLMPVDSVPWYEARDFTLELTKRFAPEGCEFRLPTEAEWEYACRAGSKRDAYGPIKKIAWFDENSRETTHNVGFKEPNAWGIYDMLGNVWEWCSDAPREYPDHAVVDPVGPTDDWKRACRGGNYFETQIYSTAPMRSYEDAETDDHAIIGGIGFRVVLAPLPGIAGAEERTLNHSETVRVSAVVDEPIPTTEPQPESIAPPAKATETAPEELVLPSVPAEPVASPPPESRQTPPTAPSENSFLLETSEFLEKGSLD